jgi:hypothetical protein
MPALYAWNWIDLMRVRISPRVFEPRVLIADSDAVVLVPRQNPFLLGSAEAWTAA